MDRKRYFGISLLINNRLSEDAHLDFRVIPVVSDAGTFRLRRPRRLAGNVSAIRFHLGLKLDPRFIRRKFAVVGLYLWNITLENAPRWQAPDFTCGKNLANVVGQVIETVKWPVH